MRRSVANSQTWLALVALLACASCRDATQPSTLPCDAPARIALAAGADTLLDASVTPCIEVSGTGTGGGEFLLVAYSGAGFATPTGVFTPFELRADEAPAATARPPVSSDVRDSAALGFHARLRTRDAELARLLQRRSFRPQPLVSAAVVPAVGDQRSFSVCSSRTCDAFTTVQATARVVGKRVAVWLDVAAPPDGYSDADLQSLATMADDQLVPIDTASFGAASDVDGNGTVFLLLSPAVNALSGACAGSGLIVGYFLGQDLVPGTPGSNGADMLYGIVPDVSSSLCPVTKRTALSALPVTFIHELQHLINFNQHVLLRGGSAELSWLNEGLSHFAEELGGRLVPDSAGAAPGSRLSQFAIADFDNAFGYLAAPTEYFLVTPSSSTGSLGERGANWLFIRWLADQFGDSGDVLGRSFTRALVGTERVGLDNLQTVTGEPFQRLAGQWLLASAAEADSSRPPQNSRLGYRSWNFQRTFSRLRDQDPGRFPRRYPLLPDSVRAAYAVAGTLRGGSGAFARLLQAPGSAGIRVRLTQAATTPIRPNFAPSFGLYRLR